MTGQDGDGGGDDREGPDSDGGQHVRDDPDSDAGQHPRDDPDGRFLVTHADEDTAVLKDVDSGQVYTLAENPGVEARDVLEGAVEPEPPMEVAYRLVDVESRRRLTVEHSEEPPTTQACDLAADQSDGELTTQERAGTGELHVLTVPEDQTDDAVADVLEDEATLVRAARLGVERVEVRSEDGVVSVRYLP